LPVLVINLKTAKSLGLTIPPDVLAIVRRGDRITIIIAALHMSAFGTKRTSNSHISMSAFGGIADIEAPCADDGTGRANWLSSRGHCRGQVRR